MTTRTLARPSRRPEALALQWRVVHDPPMAGSRNMALDHALAIDARPGRATLRMYSWSAPTVSFGRNEPSRGLYSERVARELGVEYARRPTGGRAVLHDHEITYSVVAPARALGGVRAAYRRINAALAEGLQSLGASVDIGKAGVVLPLDAGPCFQSPADGEVVAAGRKLVGSAQARFGETLLQHGSIIVAGDQSRLTRLSTSEEEHPAPATLVGLLGKEVAVETVWKATELAMQEEFGGDWESGGYDSQEVASADRLENERYKRRDWVWRR